MGKGTIPYEMITRYDSLDIAPKNGQFFLPHQFYSSLKDTKIWKREKILPNNETGKIKIIKLIKLIKYTISNIP